jgi:hypothetical protein
MADTFTILNGVTVVWGTEDSDIGTLIDSNVEDTAQFEKVENNQGAVVGVVIYDIETAVTLEILADSTGSRPEVGDELTLGSVKAWVMKSAEKAGNKTTKKWSVTANKWTNCAPTA